MIVFVESKILIILALGIVITGCSKTSPSTNIPPTNSKDTQSTANVIDDLNINDGTANPDIGTLDDTNVSEELPQ